MKTMLSTARLQAITTRIRYRPGWIISVYDGMWEGQHVQITGEVPDAYDPGQTQVLDVHSSLPPQPDEASYLVWLMARLIRIESHEAREFFTLDGERPFDPHAEFADRDLPPSLDASRPTPV